MDVIEDCCEMEDETDESLVLFKKLYKKCGPAVLSCNLCEANILKSHHNDIFFNIVCITCGFQMTFLREVFENDEDIKHG